MNQMTTLGRWFDAQGRDTPYAQIPPISSPDRSRPSLAASALLHAVVIVGLVLAPTVAPTVNLAVSRRSFVRLAPLPLPMRAPAPRSPKLRAGRGKAPPASAAGRGEHAPKTLAAETSDPRRFFRRPPDAVPPPTPQLEPPQAAPPPESLARVVAPSPVPADPPRLGPAPIRTGEFHQLQLALPVQGRPAGPAGVSFGGPVAVQPAQPARASDVVSGGFGAATVALPAVAPAPDTSPARSFVPVEIQFKPRPEYTPEARREHIEGEVLLEILFTAAGEARLVRMVRGLGYGLDQTAEAAAGQIRFRPASRAGIPVDSLAVVHIEFQLAY
jgi:TonB family protein